MNESEREKFASLSDGQLDNFSVMIVSTLLHLDVPVTQESVVAFMAGMVANQETYLEQLEATDREKVKSTYELADVVVAFYRTQTEL